MTEYLINVIKKIKTHTLTTSYFLLSTFMEQGYNMSDSKIKRYILLDYAAVFELPSRQA